MNLSNLLLVQDGALEPHMLLGMQVMFSVPDKGVLQERVTNIWQSEGLDQSLVPEKRTLVNCAEGACRSVETRRGSRTPDGHRLVVQVDRLPGKTSKVCEYQLTRQVFDEANRVIDHKKGMVMRFDADAHAQGLDPWDVQPLQPDHYSALRGLEQDIRDHFTANVGMVPGQFVRNAIRRYLMDRDKLAATPMRESGGVYFVPIEHAGTLESLHRVVTGLYADAADFDMLPVANSEGCREIVGKYHRRNVRDDAAELVAEIANRLKDDKTKPRKDWAAGVIERRRALGQHRKQMAELLGQEQQSINDALAMIDEQIERLWAVTA